MLNLGSDVDERASLRPHVTREPSTPPVPTPAASPARLIKALLKARDWPGAIASIRATLEHSPDSDTFVKLGKYIAGIPPEAAQVSGLVTKRVAILGGYTTSFTALALTASLFRKGIHALVWESEYGLIEQAIRSGDAALQAFKPDVAYFNVGSEHLASMDIESEAQRWCALWSACHALLGCPIIQSTFEEPSQRVYGNFELKAKQSRTRVIRGLNVALFDRAPAYVHFSDVDYISSRIGKKNFRDEKFYDLAKLPVAQEHLVSYVENTAAVIGAVFGRSRKCLVLDLDNTLWGGVIGDDGLGGIKIGEDSDAGEAFKRFQTYIRDLAQRGVILAVCSKNEEANAKEPFEKRSDMVLSLKDISCFVANWEPKHINIRRIAEELNIGLDSLVFVDDNPAEREIVRRHLPEVAVLEMPIDPAAYADALASANYFETVSVTDDDRARTDQYQANRERVQLEQAAGSYEDYLKSLDMKAAICAFDAANLPRITQLINKTNQFNLTTKRYTETETDAFAKDTGVVTRYAKLRDRFGDNGLISVLVAKPLETAGEAEIDTWLMSCRVLKRDLEHALLDDVVRALHVKGIKTLRAMYLPTKKNGLVRNLLSEQGFVKTADLACGGSAWSLDIETAIGRDRSRVIELVSASEYGEHV